MAILIGILVNQLGVKLEIGIWSKTQEWDCKMKHANETLAKNIAKPVF